MSSVIYGQKAGLGSGYVHDCRPDSEGRFEVVVGRILSKNKGSRSLGFMRTIDSNHAANDRLMKRLCELGPMTDDVPVLTDGDPGLRGLLMSALPKATHILDWFHLTRRLTVLKRVLHGKEAIGQFPNSYHDRLCRHLESLKWRLWHGYRGVDIPEDRFTGNHLEVALLIRPIADITAVYAHRNQPIGAWQLSPVWVKLATSGCPRKSPGITSSW